MTLRVAWFPTLCLTLVVTALAQGQYDNGPANGAADVWSSSFGHTVSDTLQPIQSFQEFSVDGMVSYGSATANTIVGSGRTLADGFVSFNQPGYDIDGIMASDLNPTANPGSTYWLNLEKEGAASGSPAYRYEDSSAGCQSSGCPSPASESAVDAMPAEVFTADSPSPVPEPSSILLFGAGILAVAVVLRRRKRP